MAGEPGAAELSSFPGGRRGSLGCAGGEGESPLPRVPAVGQPRRAAREPAAVAARRAAAGLSAPAFPSFPHPVPLSPLPVDEIAGKTHAELWALAAAGMLEYSLHPSVDRKEAANSHHGGDTSEMAPRVAGGEQTRFPAEQLAMPERHRVRLAREPC